MTKLNRLVIGAVGAGMMLVSATASAITIPLPGGHQIIINLSPLVPAKLFLHPLNGLVIVHGDLLESTAPNGLIKDLDVWAAGAHLVDIHH